MVAALGYALSSYCTTSVADVNALGSIVIFCMGVAYGTPPVPPLFPFHCWYFGFLVVISFIYFVDVHGKGFPVDSSPCVYLSFFSARLVGEGFLI